MTWTAVIFEKVRQEGQVQDAAVLLAVGVNQEGKREVLGVSVSLSEHEVHWRNFLQRLVARDLSGVELIISDAHSGLKRATRAVFGGVPWQRCQCHLLSNLPLILLLYITVIQHVRPQRFVTAICSILFNWLLM